MLCYLAGACSCYYKEKDFEKANFWREKAENILLDTANIKSFNPAKNFDANMKYEDAFVDQNIYFLNNCDILLVNLDRLEDSYGTIFEIIIAYSLNKPIIAFGTTPLLKHPHIKKMLIFNTFTDLDEALDFILNAYYYSITK